MHGPATIVGPGAGPPVLFSLVSDALVLKVGQIKIFFDPGENAKGDYLRITKVRQYALRTHHWIRRPSSVVKEDRLWALTMVTVPT